MRKIIILVFCLLSLTVTIQAENMLSVQEAIALYEDDQQEYNGQKVIEIIKELISKGINATDDSGYTSLSFSSRYGYTELVKSLIAEGAYIEIQNNDGFTALDQSLIHRTWEVFHVLVVAGAKFEEKENIDYTFKDLSLPQKLQNARFIKPPSEGFVPDEETAKQIAEAIWTPIYGDQSSYKPFVVTLIDNKTWIVEGTLSGNRPFIRDGELVVSDSGEPTMLVSLGWIPYIEIDKQSGTILGVAQR